MTLLEQQVITADELWHLPENGMRHELVDGKIHETMSPGGRHGAIAVMLAVLLQLWTQRGAGGYVSVESGYVLAQTPDTVRGPDVSYVRADRIPVDGVPEGFWHLAPDLAVEWYRQVKPPTRCATKCAIFSPQEHRSYG